MAETLGEDLEALYSIKNHSVEFEEYDVAELFDEFRLIFPDSADRRLVIAEQWPKTSRRKGIARGKEAICVVSISRVLSASSLSAIITSRARAQAS